jgi:hypothetical protein
MDRVVRHRYDEATSTAERFQAAGRGRVRISGHGGAW